MDKIRTLFSASLLILVLIAPEARSQNAILAKAGHWFITEDEFVRRFELTPGIDRQRKSGLEESKEAFLYSLIAEKLLAQEAVAKGWEEDSSFQRAYDHVRSMIVRDELYREEVSSKVRISEPELIQGMAQALRQKTVAYLFLRDKAEADFLRQRIRSRRDLVSMVLDSTMDALKDTATVIWGNADWFIEREVYRLKPGQVSPVLRARDGFYILTVIRDTASAYFTSLSTSALQSDVSSILRTRKEKARFDQFTDSFFRGKKGYAVAAVLKRLALAVKRSVDAVPSPADTVTDPLVWRAIGRETRSWHSDTLAVAGTTVWNVGEIVEGLQDDNVVLKKSDTAVQIADKLDLMLRERVEQELLAQEGLRRKLYEKPAVKRKLEMWKSSMLAATMRAVLERSVTVDSIDVWNVLNRKGMTASIPRVELRELWTTSLTRMEQAMASLRDGVSFGKAVEQWSENAGSARTRGLTGYFPVTDREPLGSLAAQMAVGERFGPVPVGGRYVLFEVEGKKEHRDSTTVLTFAEAAKEAKAMKQRRLLATHIAALGEQEGFMIYQDRLRMVKVSGIPMVTFRLLGFGGRMFEVPFVRKQIDWLDVGKKPETVIP